MDKTLRPRYLAIAAALQRDIEAGHLPAGTRLPTHRDLAFQLGVTVGTVSRAYDEADRRGLIQGEVGRGTFVLPRLGAGLIELDPEAHGLFDLSVSRPPDNAAAPELREALAALSHRRDLPHLLSYQPEAGLPAHRAAGAAWLERATGLIADPERLFVVSGAQHGLYAALAAFARPGEVVLTEALTYPGIKLIANQLGIALQPVAMDEDGLQPEALEAACQRWRPRALVTVPTIHNPTSAILPEPRRREIAAIARRHELLVIEDNIYGFLAPEQVTHLAELAPERVIHVTSLSKSMAPGLRVGYVLAPEALVPRLGAVLRGSVWMTAPLLGEIARLWIEGGMGDRLAAERLADAHARQALAARYLAGQRITTKPSSFHLWLQLPEPWRASEFVALARRRGVLVTAPEAFVVGREEAPHAVRVCLSAVSTIERLETALGILSGLLAAPAGADLAVV